MMLRRNLLIITMMLFAFSFGFGIMAPADADAATTKVIKPSGKTDSTDAQRINKALKSYQTVKLKKGKKYYLASPLHLRNNRTLIATGATIVAKYDTVTSDLKKADYMNLQNVTIDGGTWKSKSKTGYTGTSFAFVHSSGIRLMNMNIKCANYNGHAVELVACRDVLMDNVKITPCGKAGASQEVMVQIDIATQATYPRFNKRSLVNGATCHDIEIRNCSITGNRAIASGYDYKGEGYPDNVHTGVVIKDCKLYGINGEGVNLTNVKDASVRNNEIQSDYDNLGSDKSTGLHYLMIAAAQDTSFEAADNTVKGYKYAIRAYSSGEYNISRVVLLTNKCYCKRGADYAIQAAKKGIDELVTRGNETFDW